MKLVKTEEAVGQVLCHDMTQIIPGVSKGPRFRKGHIVREEDIPVLLSMGKDQLYVWGGRTIRFTMKTRRRRFSGRCARGREWKLPKPKRGRSS